MHVQLRKSQTKTDQITKTLSEKNDDIAILENTLKNRDSEIVRLSDELNAAVRTNNKVCACEHCELLFRKNDDLEHHIQEIHAKPCSSCDEKFVDLEKLKTHTCRIHIKNPSSEDLYMKNWYVKHSCISVFSVIEKKEVVVLHSSLCVNTQHCSVCPRSLPNSIRVVEKGLIHLHAYCVVKSREVHWDMIDFKSGISD